MVDDILGEISSACRRFGITTIVDVFGGAGNIILNVPQEWRVKCVYNDLDSRFYTLLKVLTDPDKRKRLKDMLDYTLDSYELFIDTKRFFHGDWKSKDEVEIAYNFVVNLVLSYNSAGRIFSRKISAYKSGSVYSYTENFERMWRRLRKDLCVDNLDFKDVIKKYDTETTLFYLDPPYYKGGSSYAFPSSEQMFIDLRDILSTIKGRWLMNESEVDFPFISNLFGEPYMVKEYWSSILIKKHGSRTKRKEGYWGNLAQSPA